MEVLNNVDDWILNLGLSRWKGGPRIDLYKGTIADRPRDIEHLYLCTTELESSDKTCFWSLGASATALDVVGGWIIVGRVSEQQGGTVINLSDISITEWPRCFK